MEHRNILNSVTVKGSCIKISESLQKFQYDLDIVLCPLFTLRAEYEDAYQIVSGTILEQCGKVKGVNAMPFLVCMQTVNEGDGLGFTLWCQMQCGASVLHAR